MLLRDVRQGAVGALDYLSDNLGASVFVAVLGEAIYSSVGGYLARRACVHRIISPKSSFRCMAVIDDESAKSESKVEPASPRTPTSPGSHHHRRFDNRQDVESLFRTLISASGYCCLVTTPGMGASSTLRDLAAQYEGVVYLSFASCRTIEEAMMVLKLEFGMVESERMSLIAKVLHRALHTVISAEVEKEESLEPSVQWMHLVHTMDSILREVKMNLKRNPLLICDHLEDLDRDAVLQIQRWAHSNTSSSVAQTVLLMGTPFDLFFTPLAGTMVVRSLPFPSRERMLAYVNVACPSLPPEIRDTLVLQYSGTMIGHLTRAIYWAEVAPMACTEDAVGHQFEAPPRCMSGPGVDGCMSFLDREFAGYFFGSTRPLHLYNMKPTGDDELDGHRLAVFEILLRLTDDVEQWLADHPEGDLLEAVTVTKITFEDTFAYMPLKTYGEVMQGYKHMLPLVTTFNEIRLLAPFIVRVLRKHWGRQGSATRLKREEQLNLLRAAVGWGSTMQ